MNVRQVAWSGVRIAAGFGLVAIVVSGADWRALTTALVATPLLALLACLLPVIGSLVEGIRIQALYRAQGLHVPFGIAFRIIIISSLFNLVIPGATGGDIVKIWYLKSVTKSGKTRAAAIWFVDRLTGVFSLLLLVSVVGLANLSLVRSEPLLRVLYTSAVAVALGVIGAVFLSRTRLVDMTVGMFTRFRRLHGIVSGVANAVQTFHERPMTLVIATSISMVGHLALLVTFITAGHFLMPDAGAGRVALLSLFGLFANALPLTPGGLGVGEAAFDGLFHLVGIDGGARLLLLWRLGLLPVCLAGGVLYMIGIRHLHDQDAIEGPPADVLASEADA